MRKSVFATCCLWLTIVMIGGPAVFAEPPTDEPFTGLAVLDTLVGSWALRPDADDGFSARQECKWILDKQFLEIDTQVLRPGQPAVSWRTLITYDKTGNCYRQWRFSDTGEVRTEQGAWNRKGSTLTLSGGTSNGNDSQSSIRIINDMTMEVDSREFLDEKQTLTDVARFTLTRVAETKVHPPTEP